ncbi:MAG: hypothetical protein EPO39_08335 [Candidatus Manganitrophaceae bacterium]|nr:MAG: hypothetical protein EPO39_08335 [Candidatus Manganitrophaceae bacterium]
MAGKKVWVTWLPTGEGAPPPEGTVKSLAGAGLQVGGSAWVDDLERMAWYDLGTTLWDPAQADLWLIAGRGDDFKSPRHRYGLSLVTAMARDRRGSGFPILCLSLDAAPDAATMPTLLRGVRFLSAAESSWPAKVAAAFLKRTDGPAPDFRLSATGHPYIGQWFEVGPIEGEWQGAMFGVSDEGKISHHLVGPKGQLPERSVLEYATQGIQAEVGGSAFTAWSVQNKIGPNDSYYIKVEGHPSKLMFGGHPGTDQAEVTVVDLK